MLTPLCNESSVATILIPGIQGTTLVNTNTLDYDTIWSGIQSKFETIDDLRLEEETQFEAAPRAIVERSDIEDLAYKEALITIEQATKSPIFIFGYDWRLSCQENGKRLKVFVEYLKEKLTINQRKSKKPSIRTDRFNFITHSMGGIVFSCYLKELQGSYVEVDHAVITVCPFVGSVHALIAILVGEGGIKFPLFNSNDVFRKIARSFPAVYELCPVYQDAVVFDSGKEFDIFNPDHWQTNIVAKEPLFIKRLARLKEFRLNQPAMLNLSGLSAEIRKKFVIIVGEGEGTKNKVKVRKKSPNGQESNFFDFEQPDGDGDGTVPLESATIYKNEILTLAVKSKFFDKSTHGFFLNDGRVQSIINRFLMGKTGNPFWWSDVAASVRKV